MSDVTEFDVPREILLSTPCWWINNGLIDPDEDGYLHFGSRDEALAYHVHGTRKLHGFPLSEAGALGRIPAVIRRETYCCVKVTCPGCGVGQHSEGPFEVCGYECGWMLPDAEPPPDNPDQERLFEVLRTDDIEGQPDSMLVVFGEES